MSEDHHFCVKPVLFFDLSNPRSILSEPEGWQKVMSVMPQHQVFDEAMPKGRPEILVVGKAYSPSGKPVSMLEAGFKLGEIEKKLSICGDRIWQKNRWWGYRQSPPADFTVMPLTWERAFGHTGNAENPIGQGRLSLGDSGETIVALPNIEYPNARLKSPTGKCQSAGFGPIDTRWAPRSTHDVAFDQDYFDRVYPGLPESLSFERFNMAPLDQQAEKLSGSEAFALWNLQPERPELVGQLPGYSPRVFTDEQGVFEEIPVTLQTVWFFPEINLGALIYCGTRVVDSRYAQMQLSSLLMAYEDQMGPTRSVAEYETILRQRTDSETRSLHALDETQLSPIPSAELQAWRAEQHTNEVDRINRLNQSTLDKYRSTMAAEHGIKVVDEEKAPTIDPRLVVSPDAVERRDFSLVPAHEYMQEKVKESEGQLNEAREKARSEETAVVISEQEVVDMALARTRDQIYVASESNLQAAKDANNESQLNSGELIKLEFQGLALALSPQPISYRKASDAGEILRQAVSLSQRNGESMAIRDFTGADLSGFDFSGADCTGSIFECANLEDCSFVGASLQGASFVGAKLSRSDFSKALLKDTNFSRAVGEDVSFCEAELSGRVLVFHARLIAADFSEAILSGMVIQQSDLIAADFYGAKLDQVMSSNSDFSCSRFVDSTLETCAFNDCRLVQTEWSGVKAHRGVFLSCELQLSYFDQLDFEKCQLAGDTWLTGTSFIQSQFRHCGFRSSAGAGMVFVDTVFRDSDVAMVDFPYIRFESSALVDCLANDSNFSFGVFASSSLIRTSLIDSKFIDVDFQETDFYQSDVLLTQFDGTDISGAKNLMPTKLKRLEHAG